MPWTHTDPVNERLRFVAKAQEGLYGMTELCARFNVSRQTGYAVLARYAELGIDGLKDRSHTARHCPHAISVETREVLLEARRMHPHWGPRTLLAWVAKREPERALPAASTVGDLFSREHLTKPRPRRRKWNAPGRTPVFVSGPNDRWTIDFKGEFRTRDATLCYPLTIADGHTRFLLAIDVLSSTAHAPVHAVMERVFREYGLPRVIRSDNGCPFASKAIAGLSRLNVWWTQLGIKQDRITRGHPEENGSHERMHLTLKQETVWPPAAHMSEQQARCDRFRAEFDFERPHQALAMQTPGSLYERSPREFPEHLPDPEYPGHCVIRPVRANGILHFRNRDLFLSEVLIGHHVALEEIADGVWSIYFYDLLLARFDERSWRFVD
jgi:transposase InsO family protein